MRRRGGDVAVCLGLQRRLPPSIAMAEKILFSKPTAAIAIDGFL
jgi:hypothetical protein